MKKVSRFCLDMMRCQLDCDSAEACEQTVGLGRFAGQQCNLLRVFSHADQIEAEIGFVALLIEIELDQRPADQMRERRAHNRIDQRRPHEIARDRDRRPEQVQRRCGRKRPKNHNEGGKRYDRAEEPDTDSRARAR